MSGAERRRVARVLRKAARIVADGGKWDVYSNGACDAIFAADDDPYGAFDSFYVAMDGYTRDSYFFWPRDEEHRSVRVIALLFAAETVLTGDCDD